MKFQKEATFLHDLKTDIRRIINDYYYLYDMAVEKKADDSPVTQADKELETFIRNAIIKNFPDDGIIGEEFHSHQKDAKRQWIIDPIDGTKSFIARAPLFGTLIALCIEQEPVLGVIYLPVTDHFIIGDGKQTTCNGKALKMKEKVLLEESTILTTDFRDFSKYKPRDGFDKLVSQCKITRTWGDCFGYFLVVSGGADVMIDPAMSIWDKMAIIPIVKGAGGTVTDFYGNDPVHGDGLVASVCSLHQKVIDTLNTP